MLEATDGSGDSLSVPVYHGGASTTPIPIATEVIVAGAMALAVHTAAHLA